LSIFDEKKLDNFMDKHSCIDYYECIGIIGGAKVGRPEQRNVEIKDPIWKNVGIMAAEIGKSKKTIVNEALLMYWEKYQTALRKEKI
jgi:hypothetical protein